MHDRVRTELFRIGVLTTRVGSTPSARGESTHSPWEKHALFPDESRRRRQLVRVRGASPTGDGADRFATRAIVLSRGGETPPHTPPPRRFAPRRGRTPPGFQHSLLSLRQPRAAGNLPRRGRTPPGFQHSLLSLRQPRAAGNLPRRGQPPPGFQHSLFKPAAAACSGKPAAPRTDAAWVSAQPAEPAQPRAAGNLPRRGRTPPGFQHSLSSLRQPRAAGNLPRRGRTPPGFQHSLSSLRQPRAAGNLPRRGQTPPGFQHSLLSLRQPRAAGNLPRRGRTPPGFQHSLLSLRQPRAAGNLPRRGRTPAAFRHRLLGLRQARAVGNLRLLNCDIRRTAPSGGFPMEEVS